MTTRVSLIAGLLAATFLTAPADAATPPLRTLVRLSSVAPTADGGDLVVYAGRRQDRLSVYDVRTGRVRHVGSGCADRLGHLLASSGRAVVHCTGADGPRNLLVDLRSGSRWTLPGAAPFARMGRRWLVRDRSDVEHGEACAYDGRTDRTTDLCADERLDPDQRNLRPRCDEPTRDTTLLGVGGNWWLVGRGEPTRVRAVSCGSRRTVAIDAADPWGGLVVGGGIVAYNRRPAVRHGMARLGAIDLRTRRKYAWTVALTDVCDGPRPWIEPLDGAILMAQATASDEQSACSDSAWSARVAWLSR